jgi:hypothetical protein
LTAADDTIWGYAWSKPPPPIYTILVVVGGGGGGFFKVSPATQFESFFPLFSFSPGTRWRVETPLNYIK